VHVKGKKDKSQRQDSFFSGTSNLPAIGKYLELSVTQQYGVNDEPSTAAA
jgi:hypothetical protein